MFRDRQDAADQLAGRLAGRSGVEAFRHPLVLAVPRGGVVLGARFAERLDGELNLVLVRKLGAPGNPEFALGAVDEDGGVVLAAHGGASQLPAEMIERERQAQWALLQERARLYRGVCPKAEVKGREVIVTDDGIATGATMEAALGLLRRQRPARLIVATAVAPPAAVRRLEEVADEVIALETPSQFSAIGEFYAEFPQLGDDEVLALLKAGCARR